MTNGLEILRDGPHVVILGAGASVAAIPNGDKYGRKISVMNGFIDNLGLRPILAGIDFKSENLEDVYSELSEHPEYAAQRMKLENAIREYFAKLCLPDEPTIYDLLLLSLKEKDVVATFNWDPLLIEAYSRCQNITRRLPKMIFLHGNVGIKLCMKDKKVYLKDRNVCPVCQESLVPSKLLFPVRHKNYHADPYIESQWEVLRWYLGRAYIVTIFGYSAPSTDVDAKQLLLDAWGGGNARKLEQIEFIDIKQENELIKPWEAFIFTHHYQTCCSFFDSLMAQSPRRTTEDLFASLMEAKWLDYPHKLPQELSWGNLQKHFAPILHQE